jgi:nitrous oxide reductase
MRLSGPVTVNYRQKLVELAAMAAAASAVLLGRALLVTKTKSTFCESNES